MTVNQPVRHAVRRALAIGAIAALGASSFAAHATQSDTAKTPAAKATPAKTATSKDTTTKTPIVLAQTTPPPSSNATLSPPVLQTVVVTGTLIARPQAETAEAITIVKADSFKNLGIVNVEQALNTVTSNVPSVNISSEVGSFSGGGTYANLRGLGNGRTLVLLDGQRLATNANNGDAVDLSGIPFSAIDSVQVLREGASAEYGSDAIAGVINFITKKNYQGAEIQVNLDHPQEAGGNSGYANFTIGHGDLVSDGYNFLLTGSYDDQQELRATQRSFSAVGYDPALGVTNTNNPGTWPATVRDGTTGLNAQGKVVSKPQLWQAGYPACAGNPFLEIDPANLGNTCAYRYSAATDLLPKSTEASALATLTKALPDNNTLQLQYLYARSMVNSYAGPMFYAYELTPQADPAYYPTASELTCEGTCATPPVLGGPIVAEWTDPNNSRFTGDINTEQRALLAFSGSNAGWDYKLTLNYSQNKSDQRNTAGLPNEAVLGPVTDPDAIAGQASNQILSNLINPFGAQPAAGQALINSSYVNGPYANGETKRWSVDGNASHPLGDAFNAGTPATVAIGFSMEGDNFNYATTPLNDPTHAATGYSDIAIAGQRTAQALFVELDVPLSKSLDVDVSDREDRYSDFGRTNNGKLTARWQAFQFLTFRGAASTGFRAPTLNDLYAPNNLEATGGSMGAGNPFCQPGSYNAEWTEATCATQGLGLNGGNRHLTPETSQNFDFGVIVSPIRNLGITLDYYRILLKNTIGNIPSSAIYGDPTQFANDVVTNDVGTLTPSITLGTACTPYTLPSCGYVLLLAQNTGSLTTDGLDLSVQYLQHTRLGTFREDLEGTSVTQFRLQTYTGGPSLNLVGWFQPNPLGTPAFRWEHELRLDWTSPEGMWGGGLSNRFYSSYIDEYTDGNGNQRTVGSQSTWDAYVTYKPVPSLTVLFGIQNLLNASPPFTNAPQNNFAAGYSALFSNPLMRDFYLNLTYRFR